MAGDDAKAEDGQLKCCGVDVVLGRVRMKWRRKEEEAEQGEEFIAVKQPEEECLINSVRKQLTRSGVFSWTSRLR